MQLGNIFLAASSPKKLAEDEAAMEKEEMLPNPKDMYPMKCVEGHQNAMMESLRRHKNITVVDSVDSSRTTAATDRSEMEKIEAIRDGRVVLRCA